LEISITPKALKVIDSIAEFVESKNTKGSGNRFVLKFKSAIERLAVPNVQYALCAHHILAMMGYSCSHFNDWVIVFKINSEELIVFEVIHGYLLF
jgi:hypothetical protein